MKLTKQHFEFIADIMKRARTAVCRTGDTPRQGSVRRLLHSDGG